MIKLISANYHLCRWVENVKEISEYFTLIKKELPVSKKMQSEVNKVKENL